MFFYYTSNVFGFSRVCLDSDGTWKGKRNINCWLTPEEMWRTPFKTTSHDRIEIPE